MKKVSKRALERIVSRMGRHKILVFGDIMLDEYIWGNVSRISPEAPVPVVQVVDRTVKLGGAANVAMNLKSLGEMPVLIGLIGSDSGAARLKQLLKKNSLDYDGLVKGGKRTTTVKTRIIAHNQQVVRADQESTEEISGQTAEKLLEAIKKSFKSVGALIISDYGKGTKTRHLRGSRPNGDPFHELPERLHHYSQSPRGWLRVRA
jgi:rfaE bifunctional protein kinase chain/domain